MTMVELTYTAAEAKNATFAETGLTRSDISFAEGDQYAILRLKRSKTDTEYTGVQIILAATGKPTCPVAALRRLFIQDPRPPTLPSLGSSPRHSLVKLLSISSSNASRQRASLRATTLATASTKEQPSTQPTAVYSTRVSRGWAVGHPTPSSSTLPPPPRHCSSSISASRRVCH